MDTTMRFQVLQLAHNSDDDADTVVERAKAYETFVEGSDQDTATDVPSSKGKKKKSKKHG